jgi:Mrp family chromosome partitioning ATPase
MIVHKAVNMAAMMEVPVVGLVENFSYFKCPDCGKEHAIFGPSKLEQTAKDMQIPVLARLPIDPGLAAACDKGEIEDYPTNYLTSVADLL